MVIAKKSLGQNWLKNPQIIQEIVREAKIKKGETVLEIGPGKGALTVVLTEGGAKVIALEKDDRLIEALTTKFGDKLELIHTDVLEFDPTSIRGGYKLVANIPYYITGQVIRKFLETDNQPNLIMLMVQKEVAERIVAKGGKESILSISVKAYGTPRYVRTVARGNFSPVPNVDSAVIAIENISKANFKEVSEEQLFDMLHRGFGSKRKQLKNNLNLTGEELASCGIGEKARAEELTLDQWLCLTKKFS